MPSYAKFAAVALAALLPFSSAQTFSDCNPLHKTCPPNPGLEKSSFDSDFTKGKSALDGWKTTAGHVETGPNGAEFTINKKGDAPTIQTDFYFLFAKVDVTMKIAPGTGIVSSVVLQSDDLDEIDWEGLGSFNDKIETNYFGKGDTTTYDRESYPPVDTPVDTMHTYTIDWKKDSITFLIDGKEVRKVSYEEAKGGSRYPQTPMNLRIGIWAGGDPSNGEGTIEWAGGATDYSQAPFTMYVESVHIQNYNPADSYKWTDNSGSWESIEFTGSDNQGSSSSSSSSSSNTQTGTSTTTGFATTTTTTGSDESVTTTTGSGSGSESTTTAGSGSSSGSGSGESGSSTGAGSGSATSSSAAGGSGSGSSSSPSASESVPLSTGAASPMSLSHFALAGGLAAAMLQL